MSFEYELVKIEEELERQGMMVEGLRILHEAWVFSSRIGNDGLLIEGEQAKKIERFFEKYDR